MSLLRRLRYLLPSVRRAADRDMRDELQALEGIAGRGALGNLTIAAENARRVGRCLWLERLAQDLRYAVRSMRRQKAFATVVVMSLALGMGANTAIYSVVDAILLRPLPVTDPESLVVLKWRAKGYTLASSGVTWSTGGGSQDELGVLASNFPYPALEIFEASDDILSSAFGYFVIPRLSVTAHDETDSLRGQYVTGRYFRGMGVLPVAGRLIQEADDTDGPAAVAVVSHRFANRRLGNPAAAIGQVVRLDDRPFTVIGVVPASFFGAEPGTIPDIYVPLRAASILQSAAPEHYSDAHYYWIDLMGRLQPGVSIHEAQTSLGARFHRFVEGTAATAEQKADLPRLELEPGGGGLDSLRRRYAKPFFILQAVAALILAIACSNVANLLLARGAVREREIAVRLGMGAGRSRIVRQLLTESLLFACIGGAVGVAIAWWGIDILTQLLASARDNFTLHARLDWRVLSAMAALSMLTGLLFGVVPALRATRVDIAPALKSRGGPQTPRRRRRITTGHGLVIAQVAFSLLLLVAAGLFGRTLANLHAIDLGFNADGVMLFTVQPNAANYEGSAARQLFKTLHERMAQLPSVQAASLSSRPLPMGGGTIAPVDMQGQPPPTREQRSLRRAALATVGPGFFETMQIPLTGREFTDRDDLGSPQVVIVNRRLARAFGIENPIGQTMTRGPRRYEIIGLADDSLALNLKEDRRPIAYFPYLQVDQPPAQMTYALRTIGDPLASAAAARRMLREVDPRLAMHDLKTLEAHVDQAISTEITLARLCLAFAILALVIACVGVYGTVAFNVGRRANEIGIRRALGAQRRRIVLMVLGDVVAMTAAGVIIGVPVVLLSTRYVESLLFGVAANDTASIATGAGALVLSALAAALLPARRASLVEPMTAVRQD